MIGVKREALRNGAKVEPVQSWKDAAALQRQKAIAEGAAHKVSDLYGDERVRLPLLTLFHSKCAYCESPIGVTGSWDVDHFRPKGAVSAEAGHPGYYWLAYDWTNLYPACQLCNQRRKDPATPDNPGGGPAAGKLDQFPLASGSVRASVPGADLSLERPLLVDPSGALDPETVLAFDPLGNAFARGNDAQAKATIKVMHLNRAPLKRTRRMRIRECIAILGALREPANPDEAANMRGLVAAIFLDAERAYVACTRRVIREPEQFGLPAWVAALGSG
ncbi:MAG: hypothetical protein ACKVVT_16375 [Dehalococcoidia bacterium]